MAAIDYTFYTGSYLGNAIREEDLPRLAARACEQIQAWTKGAVRPDEKSPEAVKKAVCVLAEVLQDEERLCAAAFGEDRRLAEETVGDWSRSYAASGPTDTELKLLERRKREALELYLGGLFPGKVRSWPSAPRRRGR